eukprot:TRINITY_DN27716_c0_g1_i1.p1 TRINITY_DN27716_c0_g1~~TRINITY_DN27716_c0_g1_i1.p1  ORF type:complete len:120 (-),score=36.66 TRINITY_DN27716_c0_g1_i1:90-449(-)
MFFFLMKRRPPRSTQSRSSAASDVYKRQVRTCTPSLAARALWLEVVVGVRILVCTMHTSLALKPSSSFPQGEPPALVGCRRHSDTHFRNTNCSYLLPSVSYTHLRAHETVLDLVFRLLL